ncbi:unnamed protein product [Haemonchus placei]|uniref:7TM_GPCR_Srx domain-containing protein n=1 Tax=Haemonchus placei TaxID=6290 RepID=A0A0N4WEH4_HAEPC|nr:unnamed protein product [Haemonchus placei]
MSTLQQLSGLSAPLLPGSALSNAQWASSQSSSQTWIDTVTIFRIFHAVATNGLFAYLLICENSSCSYC